MMRRSSLKTVSTSKLVSATIDLIKIIVIKVIKQKMNTDPYNNQRDSLDHQAQHYQRGNSGYSKSNQQDATYRPDLVLKNIYRQQLDDFSHQKQLQKRIERERQMRERNDYNEKVLQGKQAEKIKELSYKNYYETLMKNQQEKQKAYINPLTQVEQRKNHLIQHNIEQYRKKDQSQFDSEQRRQSHLKRLYQQQLTAQLHDNKYKNAVQAETNHRIKDQYQRKINISPLELSQYERQRKLLEMQKYKEDLDKTKPQKPEMSPTMSRLAYQNPGANDFNTSKLETIHHPIFNPMVNNMQNPYLLKQLQINSGQHFHQQAQGRRGVFN